MENNTSNERIIDRIERLLAMSKDESSINEAAIALKRARALMDKHQISMADIENQQIITKAADFKQFIKHTTYKRFPSWLETLMAAVAQLNDCSISKGRNGRGHWNFKFEGFKNDVDAALLGYEYLTRMAENHYQIKKNEFGLTSRRQRTDFFNTFANTMSAKCKIIINERNQAAQEEMGQATGCSLMVMKKNAVAEHFGEFNDTKEYYQKTRPQDKAATLAGALAAKNTAVSPQAAIS